MKNNTPLLSIIVPVYNVEKYLYQCLTSIINQEYTNLEILVVNDASTDNSLEIIQEFAKKDSRIIVIDCPENNGYGKTINTGLEKSTGEWIGIVESDDFILGYTYRKLMNNISLTDAPIIRSDYFIYYDNTKNKKEKSKKYNSFSYYDNNYDNIKNKKEIYISDITIKDNLKLFYLPPSIWSAIYKRDFLLSKNIKLIETPGASYQDFIFFAETLFEAKNIYLINEPLYYYRQTNMNSSINSKKMVFIIFELTKMLEETLKKRDWKKFISYKHILYLSFIQHYYYNFYRISHKYRKDYLKIWKQQLEYMIDNGLDLTRIYPERQLELEAILYKGCTIHYLLLKKIFSPLKKYFCHLKNILLKDSTKTISRYKTSK